MVDALLAWALTVLPEYTAAVAARPVRASVAPPREPYLSAYVSSERSLGCPERYYSDEKLMLHRKRRALTVLLDLFGPSAQNDADSLAAAAYGPSALRALSPHAIADVSRVAHPGASPRASLLLTVHTSTDHEAAHAAIESVEYDLTT